MTRITNAQIPLVKSAILVKRQSGKCAICDTGLTVQTGRLDHDHVTGLIRGVLCNNCNGIEGKIKNLVTRGRRWHAHKDYLGKLLLYWIKYETDQTNLFHPLHKTEDEKRLTRNKKARKKRAVSKKGL
jgi:hypothetical protein